MQGMWARLHSRWPSIMPEFQRAGVPPPKHPELPTESLQERSADKRTYLGNTLEQKSSGFQVALTTAPTKGSRKYPQNAIPSVPAWLTPNETNRCQWSRSHRGKRKHTATQSPHDVILLHSCVTNLVLHSCSQVPNNVFCFRTENKKQESTSNRQSKLTPLFETPSAVPKSSTVCLWSGSQRLTVFHPLLAHRTQLPEWLKWSGDQHKACEFLKIMLYANFF